MTVPATINPFRVALRHRNFRLFWIGQTLSLIGTWMQTMAQGWLALELTNSAFLVGLVATASSIPILFFTMPAGAIVDRSDKLRIVRIAQVAFLVEASTLWALTVTRPHHDRRGCSRSRSSPASSRRSRSRRARR